MPPRPYTLPAARALLRRSDGPSAPGSESVENAPPEAEEGRRGRRGRPRCVGRDPCRRRHIQCRPLVQHRSGLPSAYRTAVPRWAPLSVVALRRYGRSAVMCQPDEIYSGVCRYLFEADASEGSGVCLPSQRVALPTQRLYVRFTAIPRMMGRQACCGKSTLGRPPSPLA